MAKLTVDVVKIDEVQDHPNADRLSVARVGGYWVVTGLNEYKAGDMAVYFPIDSILPEKLERYIFANSKMKLDKHRVRAVRIRGIVSQGLLVSADGLMNYLIAHRKVVRVKFGDDVAKVLGVTKYEQPRKLGVQGSHGKKVTRYTHPMFKKGTSINHLRKFPYLFDVGEPVIVTEKLHGMNFRAGWVPFVPRTIWQRIKKWLKKAPVWEFVYGSHNVQLQDNKTESNNVHKRIVKEHDLENKIPYGQVWYGELIGNGIQANYSYGYGPGKIDVFFFDVRKHGVYVSFDQAKKFVCLVGEKMVPAMPPVPYSLEDIDVYLNELVPMSVIDKDTPREGLVIRSVAEDRRLGQRCVLKCISDRYLLQKGNTEFH